MAIIVCFYYIKINRFNRLMGEKINRGTVKKINQLIG